jgi:prolipoprotein diacylglyceryltransferase
MSDNQKDKSMTESQEQNQKPFDRIFYALMVICGVLFVAGFFTKKKTGLAVESIPALYVIAALVSALVLFLGVRIMRSVLMRDENYYASRSTDSEAYPLEDTDRETIHD